MSKVLFVRELASAERERLRGLIRGGTNARTVGRALVVRLSSQGRSPRQIAAALARSYSGVRKIINRFNTEGFDSLADKPRVGRPSKKTDRYVALLRKVVQRNPRDFGYPFSAWTLERLREHLGRETRILFSPSYLSRLMAENDIVYRRPKHSMAHLRDPREYDEKQAILEFLKRGPHANRPTSTCSTSMSVRFTSTRP